MRGEEGDRSKNGGWSISKQFWCHKKCLTKLPTWKWLFVKLSAEGATKIFDEHLRITCNLKKFNSIYISENVDVVVICQLKHVNHIFFFFFFSNLNPYIFCEKFTLAKLNPRKTFLKKISSSKGLSQ